MSATASVIILPGSPALVRELAPSHEPSQSMVRRIREALAGDPRPVHIVGSRAQRWHTTRTGTFTAWGAPQVDVGAGEYLPELVARYVLAGREVTASRERIAPLDPAVLTAVVVDGSAGLSVRAPLSLIDGAVDLHQRTTHLVSTGVWGEGATAPTAAELEALGVVEPQLWRELTALQVEQARLIDSDDSLGVGRYAALWQVRV